jgi:hypothetical protein
MFLQAINTVAKAKIVKNAKLKTLRLVVAFNVTETDSKGRYKFPVSSKCDYVSGDLAEEDVFDALQRARAALNTSNIELV